MEAGAYETIEIQGDPVYKILSIEPTEVFEGVTFFSLGSVGYLSLLEEYGYVLAAKAKALGVSGAIIGRTKPATKATAGDGRYLSSSPYLTAEALKCIAKGLLIGGIFPIVDLEQGYDVDVLKALVSRETYIGLLCRSQTLSNDALLSDFLSRNNWFPILLDSGLEDTTAITHTFFWDFPLSDEKREEIRKNLLLMAIVQVKKPPFSTEIQVIHNNQTAVKPGISYVVIGDPTLIPSKNVQGAVWIPLNEPFLIQEAKNVLNGLSIAKGKKNW
ncbi:MAG: hypothetical protein GX462_04230 [Thermotogaceae bacterium]|nr:hypothetical protein [Thermotogaceae bacterium]